MKKKNKIVAGKVHEINGTDITLKTENLKYYHNMKKESKIIS